MSLPLNTTKNNGDSMRKVPRGNPTVTTDCMIVGGAYDWKDNQLLLGNLKYETEDYILDVLIHEINHYAQCIYLDKREIMYSIEGFQGWETPFVEYICVPAGHYDFSKWERKYHRKVKALRSVNRYIPKKRM